MKIIRAIHTFYGVFIFTVLFILFFFPLLIPIIFPSQFRLVGVFNRWWAHLLFLFIGLPHSIEYRSPLDPDEQYIFCPNHFSYLDIAAMGLNRHNTIFVGKSSMGKIPFFGFMYNSLHITVDREKLKSRYSTMMRTFQALDHGKSLVIFPEGGIVTEHDPLMGPFKNGAFRASIEKQISIVPVTIPFNWIILPVDEFLLRRRRMKIIFHEPVDPSRYSMKEIAQYKQHVRNIIEGELKKFEA